MNPPPNGPTRIIGLAGWSGSGKTTLITRLIPRLIARGIRVSTLKHAHHGFDLDQPGRILFFHRPPVRLKSLFRPPNDGQFFTSCAKNRDGICALWFRKNVACRSGAGRGLQA